MKSFSNLSHPDLRIILAALQYTVIASKPFMSAYPSISNIEQMDSMIADLNDKMKLLKRIDELVDAIKAELRSDSQEEF